MKCTYRPWDVAWSTVWARTRVWVRSTRIAQHGWPRAYTFVTAHVMSQRKTTRHLYTVVSKWRVFWSVQWAENGFRSMLRTRPQLHYPPSHDNFSPAAAVCPGLMRTVGEPQTSLNNRVHVTHNKLLSLPDFTCYRFLAILWSSRPLSSYISDALLLIIIL